MNREESTEKLREALSGEVPPEVVRENLQYYGNYIREEQKKGRSEQEVMEELGDPRLIARTIIDTTPGGGNGGFPEYHGMFGFGSSDGREGDRTPYENVEPQSRAGVHYYDLNKWYWKLLGILLLIGVVALIIAIVSGILAVVIPLLPILAAVLVVLWFVQGF